jgi:5-methylcytosine-specific restriction enzyme subunit McrC
VAVLAVREYQRIHCGAGFNPSAQTITHAQRQSLERFNEDYKKKLQAKVFEYGPGQSLIAQNYVGVIDLGKHQLEILPKIEGANESQVRHNLAEMIAVALDIKIHGDAASAMKQPANSLLEIFIRLFCIQLWAALHRGIIRRYEARSADLPLLRGRLDIARQIRRHATRHDLLACKYDEFSEDNALNQVLKAALNVLSGVVRTIQNERDLRELSLCFEEVQDVHPANLRWHAARVDRLSKRYEPLLRLAKLFIAGKAPDVVTGRGEGYAMLFDMSDLFEKYVGRMARRVAVETRAVTVTLQFPGTFLARREGVGSAFELRPDIVAREEGRVIWIADTKWKRLDLSLTREGLGASDMYQMHAYSRRFDADDVVLIFPHHEGLGPWKACRDSYQISAEGKTRRVRISSLDLRDLSSVGSQLRAALFAACT